MQSPFIALLASCAACALLYPFTLHCLQALRPKAGSWIYLRFNADELTVDEINAGQYLAFKEHLVEGECIPQFCLNDATPG